jgi:RecA/RadA recombinase
MDLDELPGVGPAIAEKLREAGFNSLEAIAVASPMELVATVEIGEATASKIITAAREAADIGGFETGDKILERRRNIGKLTTGSKSLVGHTATFRLYLRKSKGEKRVAKLVDSPNMPEAEVVFSVSSIGIRD